MRKLFRVVLASMAVAAALTGCGGKKVKLRQTAGLKRRRQKPQTQLDQGGSVGNEKLSPYATYFGKIEELSGGQVKVTIYPNFVRK
ncbi:MAG: hypothetical protein ACLUOI_38175 [Eisenbergiella sp.]